MSVTLAFSESSMMSSMTKTFELGIAVIIRRMSLLVAATICTCRFDSPGISSIKNRFDGSEKGHGERAADHEQRQHEVLLDVLGAAGRRRSADRLGGRRAWRKARRTRWPGTRRPAPRSYSRTRRGFRRAVCRPLFLLPRGARTAGPRSRGSPSRPAGFPGGGGRKLRCPWGHCRLFTASMTLSNSSSCWSSRVSRNFPGRGVGGGDLQVALLVAEPVLGVEDGGQPAAVQQLGAVQVQDDPLALQAGKAVSKGVGLVRASFLRRVDHDDVAKDFSGKVQGEGRGSGIRDWGLGIRSPQFFLVLYSRSPRLPYVGPTVPRPVRPARGG